MHFFVNFRVVWSICDTNIIFKLIYIKILNQTEAHVPVAQIFFQLISDFQSNAKNLFITDWGRALGTVSLEARECLNAAQSIDMRPCIQDSDLIEFIAF